MLAIYIIVDILLLAVLAVGVIIGIKKGFIRVVAKPVKAVLAFFIAFSLASPVGNAIVKPIIAEPVTNQVSTYIVENCPNITADNASKELPTLVKMAAGICGIDIGSVAEGAAEDKIVKTIITKISDPLAGLISSIIAFFLLYIAFRLLLRLGFFLIDKILNRGVVGALNKVLGAIMAGLITFILLWIATVLFEWFIHTGLLEGKAIAGFEGGGIYKMFKTINPVYLLLSF